MAKQPSVSDTVTFDEVPNLAIFRPSDGRRYQKVNNGAWEVCSRQLTMVRSGERVDTMIGETRCYISIIFDLPNELPYEEKAKREDGTWFGLK